MIIATILILVVPVLLSVAMMTLAERTVMASMQRRYGPQVSGIGGLLQPFCVMGLLLLLCIYMNLGVCYADSNETPFALDTCWDINLLYEWATGDVVQFFSGLVTNSLPAFLVFYLGYAIGFFDGEGSIICTIRRQKGTYRITMCIKVSQNYSRVAALKALLKVFGVGFLYEGAVCEIKVQSLTGLLVWCNILLLGSIAKRRQLLLLRYLLQFHSVTLLKNPQRFLINCYLVNNLQSLNDQPSHRKRLNADAVAKFLLSSNTLTKQQVTTCKEEALQIWKQLD